MMKKLLERFMIKTFKKQIKIQSLQFRVEKAIKRKGDEIFVKWKRNDNSFNSWTNKKDIVILISYFPEPYTYSKNKIEVQLDCLIMEQNLT